jgi:hypothetical protein
MTTAWQQFYKPYRILDEDVTSQHIVKAEHVLRRERFTFHDLGVALVRAGVSYEKHDRAADRLLQRARKLDLIAFGSGRWHSRPKGWAALDASYAANDSRIAQPLSGQ